MIHTPRACTFLELLAARCASPILVLPQEIELFDRQVVAPNVAANLRRAQVWGAHVLLVRTEEVRTDEVRIVEGRTVEVRTVEVRTAEVRIAEVRTAEVRTAEVRIAEARKHLRCYHTCA